MTAHASKASRVGRGLAAGALGAQLLTHSPTTDAAEGNGKGVVAKTFPRPTRIDAGGGAVAFLVESHEIPLVDLSISFRSGSALESAQKVGMTRLMGRMLRRGAVGWTSDKIEETIDLYGGEISVDVSASSINVHAQVIRRNLEPFVKLVTQLLTQPSFPKDELERLQREAVAEIIEARDHDKSVASKFFREAVFGKHPYGRGTTGTTKSIPTITREDVIAAHALHFKRGNIVLGIAGDLTEDDAKKLVLPLVAAFPAGAANADPTGDPVFPKGRKLVFVDKPARTQTQILVGASGTHANDPDHVALHVANTVFGGTFTARLMKEVRSKRGWSYGAYARMPIDRRREAFSMWTFPAATDAPACITLEVEMLDELVKNGITEQELGFAKSYLSESYAFDIDTAYKRVRQAVDEEIYSLPADYHTAYVKKILAVTKPEADAALKKRLSTADFVVVVVGTAADLKDKIEKAIPGLTEAVVVPYDQE